MTSLASSFLPAANAAYASVGASSAASSCSLLVAAAAGRGAGAPTMSVA
jgi:hypothetical protein